MTENERTLWLVAGIYLISKYAWQWTPALQQQGVRLYEAVNNDEAHRKDLPGKTLTRQAVLDIATRAGFPDPKLAAAIAMAESGGVTNAVLRSSREYSVGLWQINVRAHVQYNAEQMADPTANAMAAFNISRGGSNWKPWSAFTNGRYKQFRTGILA